MGQERWDDIEGTEQNPKDCENCANMIDEPRLGICKAFDVVKPYEVFFEGEPCPKKIPLNANL